MSRLKTTTMRDGTVAAEATVLTTMNLLNRCLENAPSVFLELVEKVRDPSYKLSDDARLKLQKMYIAKRDGSIVEATAEIIRNAVVGEGLDMKIVNPLADSD